MKSKRKKHGQHVSEEKFVTITNKPIWSNEDIESTLRYMEGYGKNFLCFYMLIDSYQRISSAHIVAFEGQVRHEGSFIAFLITLAQNIFIEGFNLAEWFRFLLLAATPFEHHTNILHLHCSQDMLCKNNSTCFDCLWCLWLSLSCFGSIWLDLKIWKNAEKS